MKKTHLVMAVLVVCLVIANAVRFLSPSSDDTPSESDASPESAEKSNETNDMDNVVSEIIDLRRKKQGREMGRDVVRKSVDSQLLLTRKCWLMDENINTNSIYKEIKDMANKANVGISMQKPTLSRIAKDSPVYLVKITFHFTDSRGRNASLIPYKDLARFMMEVDRLPHKYEWSSLRILLDSRDKTKVRVISAILTTKMIDKKNVAVIREIRNKVHQ